MLSQLGKNGHYESNGIFLVWVRGGGDLYLFFSLCLALGVDNL
jgi:hypothetical protein